MAKEGMEQSNDQDLEEALNRISEAFKNRKEDVEKIISEKYSDIKNMFLAGKTGEQYGKMKEKVMGMTGWNGDIGSIRPCLIIGGIIFAIFSLGVMFGKKD